MMFTINDYFIDSSILIEYNKGNKLRLFSELSANDIFRCFVNETVLSEFLFHFLAYNGKKSPQSLHESNKITHIFASSDQYKLIKTCYFLDNDKRLYSLVPDLMAKYNLLPNDAIILATCKLHGIKNLASHDKDFEEACKVEGISLVSN
ncbi:MAG: type II toxin-antitoxin system VapC family toxin [Parafilimonas sp.]